QDACPPIGKAMSAIWNAFGGKRTSQLHRKMSAYDPKRTLSPAHAPMPPIYSGMAGLFLALLRVQNTEKPVEQKIMICNGDGGGRGADYANFMACCLLISAEHRIGARATGPRVA